MQLPSDFPRFEDDQTREEIRLSSSVIQDIYRRHKWETPYSNFRRMIRKAVLRFHSRYHNLPVSTKRERVRELNKLQSAAERVLAAIDELSDEHASSLNLVLLDQWVSKIPLDRSAELSTEAFDGIGLVEPIVKSNADLLRACRNLLDLEDQGSAKDQRPMNKPLDDFIRDLADVFGTYTILCPVAGCYYSDSASGYVGDFYRFVYEIAEAHLPRSSFHSPDALGKRTTRVMKLRDKKDKR